MHNPSTCTVQFIRKESEIFGIVYSTYELQRILQLHDSGLRPPTIAKVLQEEGKQCSRVGVYKFIKRYKQSGSILRRPGSGRPSRITAEVKAIVDQRMAEDDETTAVQLHSLLISKGYILSLRTVLRCRSQLGWTFRGSAYCQIIRDANKVKRLNYALANRDYHFNDVIFTDECSVQLETHRRFSCRRRGEQPRPKPRYTRSN